VLAGRTVQAVHCLCWGPTRMNTHRLRRRRTPITDLETHAEAHVSLDAVAEYLALARKTIVKFVDAGLLPAFRFGRAWRVRTADLRAFVEQSRHRPARRDHVPRATARLGTDVPRQVHAPR
jgi:excisionase family DNA binding protein